MYCLHNQPQKHILKEHRELMRAQSFSFREKKNKQDLSFKHLKHFYVQSLHLKHFLYLQMVTLFLFLK